jgi:hypothetical protein
MSDVDVMVIGRARLADLSPALRKAEARLGKRSTSRSIPQRSFGRKSNRATISLPPFYEDGNSL